MGRRYQNSVNWAPLFAEDIFYYGCREPQDQGSNAKNQSPTIKEDAIEVLEHTHQLRNMINDQNN